MCRFWITIGKESVNCFDSLNLKNSLDSLYLSAGPDYQNLHKTNSCLAYHSRLAIQDLSSNSNQPLTNDEGDIFVFNGEIFNWPELVKSFPKELFPIFPVSDSQFLFSILVKNQFDKISTKLRGFFSFVFFSPKKKLLSYARDCFGVKPLYFLNINNKFPIFASTPESIMIHPKVTKSIDTKGIKTYIKYGFFPGQSSIYSGVKQIEPGIFTEIKLNDDFSLSDKKKTVRFDFYKILNESRVNFGTQEFSSEKFREVLKESCQTRLLADVPSALLLSGGLDSNLLAWTYSDLLDTKLPCFTLAFNKSDINDESIIASQTCSKLNLEHHILNFDDIDISQSLLTIISKLDQPFIDTSILPSMIICDAVSKSYKVAISGEGADESFGGYTKYRLNEQYFNLLYPFKYLQDNMIKFLINFSDNNKFLKMVDILQDREKLNRSIYFHQHRLWNSQIIKKFFLKEDNDYEEYEYFNHNRNLTKNRISELQILDLFFYMRGDILFKIDRASMFTGIELREPFLDQSIVSYGLGLKTKYKLSLNSGKKCIRDFLSDKLPHVCNLKKKGFGIPIYKLCGILDKYFDDVIYDSSSSIWNVLNKDFVIKLLKSSQINKTQEWQLKILLTWLNIKGL